LSIFSGSIANAARHSLENYDREKLERRVEPLLFLIREGRNWFMPRQFSDLCLYLLNEQQLAFALDTGRFIVGDAEVIRTKHVDESRLVTLGALSKMTGVARRTLVDMAARCSVPFIRRGNQKLFNIDEMRLYLAERCA
jgi:hypothetical protein